MAELAAIVDEDVREVDLKEQEKIDVMVYKECGCQRGPGKTPCSRLFTRTFVEDTRDSFHSLTSEQLDMIVLGQLHMHRRSPVFVKHYQEKAAHKKKELLTESYIEDLKRNFRPTTKFFVHDIQVCETTFCFLHTLGRARLHNLQSHFDANGLVPRTHGLTGIAPAHAYSPDVIEDVVNFIKSISDVRSIPLPGRLPSVKDLEAKKLPSDLTKSMIHREYEDVCKKAGKEAVSLTTFKSYWLQYVPNITILKPRSDLCTECQDNNILMQSLSGLPDELKEKRLETAIDHLKKAATQRDHYNTQCHLAKERAATGRSDVRTISFDYAQNVSYPHSASQVGPAYFKTGRKCSLFGVLDEADNIQTNYVIDESDSPGKGANSVISLLDHYLDQPQNKANIIEMHADNCCGQNKNNAVAQYLLWRVMSGRSHKVQLSFMLAGHTKFGPDRMFGHIKKRYNKCVVDTLDDVKNVIKTSTINDQNLAVLTHDYVTNVRNVVWRDWSTHLHGLFKPVPDILTYQHFSVEKGKQHIVMVQKSADSPAVEINLKKATLKVIKDAGMPSVLTPKGLSPERAWYLYEQVRSLCSYAAAGDLTCPQPTCPKPRKRKATEE